MNKSTIIKELILKQGLLPLFFHDSIDVCIDTLIALQKSGIRVTEYAHRGENAIKNFKQMREFCSNSLPGMYLGIGTIKNDEAALAYIEEGTDFIVSPGMIKKVGEISLLNNVLWIPGCMTPTEIIEAENMGAEIIKLYPSNSLGKTYMAAIKPVFPDLLFMPTGGVELDEENIRMWFNSGASALGGSKIITKEILELKKYDDLINAMSMTLSLIKRIKKEI